MTWPDSGDRPVHDGDRMVALVRGIHLVTVGLASVPFRRLEARLRAAAPQCGGCGWRHWPGDNPDCKEKPERPPDENV